MNRFGSGCGWNKLGSSKIEKGGGVVPGLAVVGWKGVNWIGLGWPRLLTSRLDSVQLG